MNRMGLISTVLLLLFQNPYPQIPAQCYIRDPADPLTRVDGTPYQPGEIVTERPIEQDMPLLVASTASASAPLDFRQQPYMDWNALPFSDLPLDLKGTYSAANGQSFAVLEHEGQQFLVKSGQEIPAYKGVRLKEVRGHYALLEAAGVLTTLRLDAHHATAFKPPNTSPLGVSADALAQVDLLAFRDNAAVDPYRLFDAVQPEALLTDGKLAGYRLLPGVDPALFVKAGLHAGDVLLAVNGVKLQNEAQAVALLEQYEGTIQLSLTLQRGREEINLPVNFQELAFNTTHEMALP